MKKNLKLSFLGQQPQDIDYNLLSTPAYQSFLATKSGQNAFCHCVTPPVPLSICKKLDKTYIRSNPGQAIRHACECPLFPAKEVLTYSKHVCESFTNSSKQLNTHLFSPPPFSGLTPSRIDQGISTPIKGMKFIYGQTKRIDVVNMQAVLRLTDDTSACIAWTPESLTPINWQAKSAKELVEARFAGLLRRDSNKSYSVIAGYLKC